MAFAIGKQELFPMPSRMGACVERIEVTTAGGTSGADTFKTLMGTPEKGIAACLGTDPTKVCQVGVSGRTVTLYYTAGYAGAIYIEMHGRFASDGQ